MGNANAPLTETGEKRRDFVILTAQALGAVGAGALIWPFVQSMNPAADVLAMASTEVNLASVAEGQEIKVMWRGKPVFIRHRNAADIQMSRDMNVADLPDPFARNDGLGNETLPATDENRVVKGKEQWLVMVGVCTHLGCVPVGNEAGDYKGWFCPCHGSHYDSAGRIRKGPAPQNLKIPKYTFTSDTTIKIG
jgi:ubiquinol-cytochrome c reductase iron-sulfur subunit